MAGNIRQPADRRDHAGGASRVLVREWRDGAEGRAACRFAERIGRMPATGAIADAAAMVSGGTGTIIRA